MPSAPSSSKINVASLIASFLYDAFGETQNQVAFMVSSNLIWSTRGFTCHVLFFSSRLLCIFWSQNLQQYKYDCFNVETLRLVTCVCVCVVALQYLSIAGACTMNIDDHWCISMCFLLIYCLFWGGGEKICKCVFFSMFWFLCGFVGCRGSLHHRSEESTSPVRWQGPLRLML